MKGKLFLGGYKSAKSYEVLNSLGITHVLNISDSCANVFEGQRKLLKISWYLGLVSAPQYLHVHLLDSKESLISEHFQRMFTFIDQAISGANPYDQSEAIQGDSLHFISAN